MDLKRCNRLALALMLFIAFLAIKPVTSLEAGENPESEKHAMLHQVDPGLQEKQQTPSQESSKNNRISQKHLTTRKPWRDGRRLLKMTSWLQTPTLREKVAKVWKKPASDETGMPVLLGQSKKRETSAGSTILQYKGKLPKPTRAKGKKKSSGLFFRTSKNSKVTSIYSGRVVYADWFRGYGYLLVLSHGERIYSLYGHNHSLLVSTGDFVKPRQVIAKSGNAGTMDGVAGLYFEIRTGNTPENPRQWLASNETMGTEVAKLSQTSMSDQLKSMSGSR